MLLQVSGGWREQVHGALVLALTEGANEEVGGMAGGAQWNILSAQFSIIAHSVCSFASSICFVGTLQDRAETSEANLWANCMVGASVTGDWPRA